jgi:hypothetical protein
MILKSSFVAAPAGDPIFRIGWAGGKKIAKFCCDRQAEGYDREGAEKRSDPEIDD